MASNLWEELPDEIVTTVFAHLDDSQLGQVASVSRQFQQLTAAPELWEGLFQRNFGMTFPRAELEQGQSERDVYRAYKLAMGNWLQGRFERRLDYTMFAGTARGVALSPDGRVVAAVSHDRSVRFLSAEDDRLLSTDKNAGYGWGVSFDGALAVTASGDGMLRGYDVDANLLFSHQGIDCVHGVWMGGWVVLPVACGESGGDDEVSKGWVLRTRVAHSPLFAGGGVCVCSSHADGHQGDGCVFAGSAPLCHGRRIGGDCPV